MPSEVERIARRVIAEVDDEAAGAIARGGERARAEAAAAVRREAKAGEKVGVAATSVAAEVGAEAGSAVAAALAAIVEVAALKDIRSKTLSRKA